MHSLAAQFVLSGSPSPRRRPRKDYFDMSDRLVSRLNKKVYVLVAALGCLAAGCNGNGGDGNSDGGGDGGANPMVTAFHCEATLQQGRFDYALHDDQLSLTLPGTTQALMLSRESTGQSGLEIYGTWRFPTTTVDGETMVGTLVVEPSAQTTPLDPPSAVTMTIGCSNAKQNDTRKVKVGAAISGSSVELTSSATNKYENTTSK
jgi:hypothetical protein